ncbi:MAG: PBP1A family penicillin-binding protein [Acidobacteriota bacterium]
MEGKAEPTDTLSSARSDADAPPAAPSRPRRMVPALESGSRLPDEKSTVRRRRLRAFVLYPAVAMALAVVTGVVVAASIQRPEVDGLDSFVPKLVTEVYDQHGDVVRTYSRENRILLSEGELPEVLQNAIVATEDANFFNHGGVDLKGIVRAMITNVQAGRIKEGASTITMQLSRELFSLTREQKWWRKIEEAFLSVELEKSYSKQQILTLYANMVNLSNGNYGVEAASREYFNKSAKDLTLPEAATLAGIPQRPSHFNVFRRPEAVTQRRDWVLRRMLDVGFITQQEHDEAVATPLRVVRHRKTEGLGPYFTEDVRRYLYDTYGLDQLYDQGLRVRTTLDPQIQRAAEESLREKLVDLDHSKGWRGVHGQVDDPETEERLPSWGDVDPEPGEWFEGIVRSADAKTAVVRHRDTDYTLGREGIRWTGQRRPDRLLKAGDIAWFRLDTGDDDSEEADEADETAEPILMLEQEPELEGAVLVVEATTGAVRAMVGGFSFERNEFNRATQAKRQIGSAFKPFVFGAALENGWTAADVLFDGPAIFPGATEDDAYSPRNYKRQYYGILPLRTALEQSVNVSSVKLLDLVGVDRVIDFARRCGIESDLPPYPSLALGSADLVPLELVASYAAIVNRGIYVEPYLVERVETREGRVLEEHVPRAHKAMEPEIAHVLSSMLQGVAVRGTGASRLGKLPIETAGKTGTTNIYTDAWFVGFTPRYAILSWVGYNEPRSIGIGMTGARAALPIWARLVERGLEDGWLEEGEAFEAPPGITTAVIEGRSGLLCTDGVGGEKPIEEVFVEGTEPRGRFDAEMSRVMALPWYLQEPYYLPKEGERMPSQIDDWTAVQEVWKAKKEREDAVKAAG